MKKKRPRRGDQQWSAWLAVFPLPAEDIKMAEIEDMNIFISACRDFPDFFKYNHGWVQSQATIRSRSIDLSQIYHQGSLSMVQIYDLTL